MNPLGLKLVFRLRPVLRDTVLESVFQRLQTQQEMLESKHLKQANDFTRRPSQNVLVPKHNTNGPASFSRCSDGRTAGATPFLLLLPFARLYKTTPHASLSWCSQDHQSRPGVKRPGFADQVQTRRAYRSREQREILRISRSPRLRTRNTPSTAPSAELCIAPFSDVNLSTRKTSISNSVYGIDKNKKKYCKTYRLR